MFLVTLAGVASAAPAAVSRTTLRSMVKAPSTSLAAMLPSYRNVAAKAFADAPGWQELSKMDGKVYDNVVFRNKDGWDPAAIAKDADVGVLKRYRDSELFHGRLGMMAVLGQLLAEKFHPFVPGATGTAYEQYKFATDNNPLILKLALAQVVVQELIRAKSFFTNDGLPAWHANIGALKDGAEPGTYGFDPLGLMPKDAAGQSARKAQEVNNGRLAMLAALGILAEEGKTGVPVMDKIFP